MSPDRTPERDEARPRVAAVLSEKEKLGPSGGATARKCREVFRRLEGDFDVTIHGFADASARAAREFRISVPSVSRLRRKGKIHRALRRFYLPSIARSIDPATDLIAVFNRPTFVAPLRRAHPATAISLHMGNDHLCTMPEANAREAIACADFVSFVSDFVLERAASRFGDLTDKFLRLYNGVDCQTFHPPGATRRGPAADGMLFAGRLAEEKGIHVLLAALPEVFAAAPSSSLTVAGAPWFGSDHVDDYVAELRRLSAPLGDRIRFTGHVPADEMPAIYRQHAILVAPAIWDEPCSNVLLEAMASGLPVVTTMSGGSSEIVGEVGTTVEKGSVEGLTAALIRMYDDDPRRERLGRHARRRVLETFDWDRRADDYARCFRNAIAERQAKGG